MADEQKKGEATKTQQRAQSEATRQAMTAKDAEALGLDPKVYGA